MLQQLGGFGILGDNRRRSATQILGSLTYRVVGFDARTNKDQDGDYRGLHETPAAQCIFWSTDRLLLCTVHVVNVTVSLLSCRCMYVVTKFCDWDG